MITKEYQEKNSRGVVNSLGKGVCEPRHPCEKGPGQNKGRMWAS